MEQRKPGYFVTLEVVKRITTNLNFTDVKGKMENCYRLHFPTKWDKPCPIVVKFQSKSTKMEFMHVQKRKNGLKASEVCF
ncbi:hypothetical protein HHI36_003931, partial [Cryptolaemus montrouzieri]